MGKMYHSAIHLIGTKAQHRDHSRNQIREGVVPTNLQHNTCSQSCLSVYALRQPGYLLKELFSLAFVQNLTENLVVGLVRRSEIIDLCLENHL